MQSISLPLWLFIIVFGLPVLTGLYLSMKLIFRKRYWAHPLRQAPADPIGRHPDFDGRFNRQIMDQQIDSAFNTLITVVENERSQLKNLVLQLVSEPPNAAGCQNARTAASAASARKTRSRSNAPGIDASIREPVQKRFKMSDSEAAADDERPIGQLIKARAAQGALPDEIARSLKLSQSEVQLAMRLQRAATQPAPPRRLEAIA